MAFGVNVDTILSKGVQSIKEFEIETGKQIFLGLNLDESKEALQFTVFHVKDGQQLEPVISDTFRSIPEILNKLKSLKEQINVLNPALTGDTAATEPGTGTEPGTAACSTAGTGDEPGANQPGEPGSDTNAGTNEC